MILLKPVCSSAISEEEGTAREELGVAVEATVRIFGLYFRSIVKPLKE